MDIFSKDELKLLVETQTVGCICVSIYLPTYRAGRTEVQQNPIRLKKLLREAQERLIGIGLRRPEADNYLQAAERLLDDSFFWTTMSDGLAIFLSKDYFHYYRLPTQFPELVMVANRFHIKPLLPLLATDGRFYVMAISQNAVRLLQCTRFGFNELNIAGKIPQSLAEALQFDDFHQKAQFYASLSGEVLRTHGGEVKETKENLLRFFDLVDRSLKREFLHNETAPLVLISVDYLFPIYKKANTYEYLVNKEVEGNPDKVSSLELHQLGVSMMEPYFKRRQEEAARLYRESFSLGRSFHDLEKIVLESYHGRVNVLFVASNLQKWGNYDPFNDRVEIHEKEESCDVDLLDFVAAHTLAHGGDVYAVEADKVPDRAPAAAVLRYNENF